MTEESSDYKEMYLKMARAVEKAINLLIEAQQDCEALYVEACREDSGQQAAGYQSEKAPSGETDGAFLCIIV